MAKTSGEIEKEFVDGLKSATRKDLKGWLQTIKSSGIEKRNDIISWLKTEHSFGHMNASLLAGIYFNEGKPVYGSEVELLENQFQGKESMKELFASMIEYIKANFKNASVVPKKTYVSITAGREFAAVNIKATELRLGLDLGEESFDEYLQKSKLTGPMPRISHMVVISGVTQLNSKLKKLLDASYKRVNQK